MNISVDTKYMDNRLYLFTIYIPIIAFKTKEIRKSDKNKGNEKKENDIIKHFKTLMAGAR